MLLLLQGKKKDSDTSHMVSSRLREIDGQRLRVNEEIFSCYR